MLVRWRFRPTSLAMLAGGGLCAVTAGQVEIWLKGIWTFDVTALAACAGAVLAGFAISRYRTSPVVYGSARFRRGRALRAFRNRDGLIIGRDGPKGVSDYFSPCFRCFAECTIFWEGICFPGGCHAWSWRWFCCLRCVASG